MPIRRLSDTTPTVYVVVIYFCIKNYPRVKIFVGGTVAFPYELRRVDDLKSRMLSSNASFERAN